MREKGRSLYLLKRQKGRLILLFVVTALIATTGLLILLHPWSKNDEQATETVGNQDPIIALQEQALKDIQKARQEAQVKQDHIADVATTIKAPEDIANLTETPDVKLSIALKVAENNLTSNNPSVAYSYLTAFNTLENQNNFDFLFFYYIAARDSKQGDPVALRTKVLEIVKQQSSDPASITSLPESYFDLNMSIPSGTN